MRQCPPWVVSGFSVFASDNGIVMTCGDGTYGCLGHGNWNNSSTPKLVESLLTVDVSAIACGPRHVVVVGGSGEVYSWGQGQGGQLGLGHEEDCSTPQEVNIPDDEMVENVRCGGDGTIFITAQGSLLACGNNARNKLGLNPRRGLISAVGRGAEIEKALVPTPVKSVTSRIIDVSIGPHHTVAITENGHLVSFGRNSEGQLGRGRARAAGQPGLVRSMMDKTVTMVQCGSTFTVVGTIDNVLYLWGTRRVGPREPAPSTSRPGSEQSAAAALSASGRGHADTDTSDTSHREVQYQPREVLALYASTTQIKNGATLSLGSLHAQSQNVFLVVDTTCPLPRVDAPAGGDGGDSSDPSTPRRGSETSPLPRCRSPSPTAPLDATATAMPDWLRDELEAADAGPWKGGASPSPRRPPPTAGARSPRPPAELRAPVTSPFAVDTTPQSSSPPPPKHQQQQQSRPAPTEEYHHPDKEQQTREREQMLNEEIEKLRTELENQKKLQEQMMAERLRGDGESGEKTPPPPTTDAPQTGGCTVM